MKISKKQLIANRANAILGGRPTGSISESAQIRNGVKLYISRRIKREQKPIVDALITRAKKGDVMAARELFDRGIGKATSPAEDNVAGAALLSHLLRLEQNLQNIANGDGGDSEASQQLLQE